MFGHMDPTNASMMAAMMANQNDLRAENDDLAAEVNRLQTLLQQEKAKLATANAEIGDLQDQLRQALAERNEFAGIAQKAVAALEGRR